MRRKRKICVVTTSRADYGVIFWLLKEIEQDRQLELQLLISGAHLGAAAGLTARQIKIDFPLAQNVKMLLEADSEEGLSKAVGLGCTAFAQTFQRLRPDLLVLCGDRFEMLAPALAALLKRIPIAHIHGGEVTQGALDDSVRHALTKLAVLHFAAAEEYRRRIIQLGEDPKRVFCFGAPGLDQIARLQLLSRERLREVLGFPGEAPTAMITYHPVTLEKGQARRQISILLAALEASPLTGLITKANADNEGRVINELCLAFCRANPQRFKFVANLGTLNYLSCLKHFDLMIGNSSSGIIEAPSFRLPVVNVGLRQLGRARSKNILDVPCEKKAILEGVNRALSAGFKRRLAAMKNVYAPKSVGRASYRIKEVLKSADLSEELLRKRFFDVEFRK